MHIIKITLISATYLAACTGICSATPISIDAFGDPWEVYHFRNTSGVNSFGRTTEDTLIFGLVNVVPNGKGEDGGSIVSPDETTAIARQSGTDVDMTFYPTTILPNQYSAGVVYDPALTGSWDITLTNGADTLVVNTPIVGNAPKIDPVTGHRITSGASTTTPTFAWGAASGVDGYKISIYDLLNRNEAGGVDRIYVSDPSDGPTGQNFEIPEGVLDPDGIYSIEVRTNILRTSGTNPSGSSQSGASLSINRTYFDFTLRDLPDVDDLYLPVVDPNSGSLIFNFNNPVLAGEIAYYDPLVAVGYDYMIGDGDPNFASFILPDIGDGLFDLYEFDVSISDYIFASSVTADSEYFFGDLGVDRFRILGIETGAGVDPSDPTAFVTGLSFVSDGRFTGTITADVAPVPIPASLPILATGLLFLFWLPGKSSYKQPTA